MGSCGILWDISASTHVSHISLLSPRAEARDGVGKTPIAEAPSCRGNSPDLEENLPTIQINDIYIYIIIYNDI